MVKHLLNKISGRKWKQVRPGTRWQHNPQFVAYFDEQISPGSSQVGPGGGHNGIHAALRRATPDVPLARGVSVGAGTGDNERLLMHEGLVERFDLYEVSADRVAQAGQLASAEGLADRTTVHLADALETTPSGQYDLVYWNSALHHMSDVDQALDWSVRALKPGGMLLVSEYVGPTRLQWTRAEVAAARRFLSENRAIIDVDPRRVRPGGPIRRVKQFLRDPSEAPQSDRIEAVFEKYTGQRLTILGGSAIHLAGGFLSGLEDRDPTIHDRLIDLDKQQREKGHYHFGFGLWHKPA